MLFIFNHRITGIQQSVEALSIAEDHELVYKGSWEDLNNTYGFDESHVGGLYLGTKDVELPYPVFTIDGGDNTEYTEEELEPQMPITYSPVLVDVPILDENGDPLLDENGNQVVLQEQKTKLVLRTIPWVYFDQALKDQREGLKKPLAQGSDLLKTIEDALYKQFPNTPEGKQARIVLRSKLLVIAQDLTASYMNPMSEEEYLFIKSLVQGSQDLTVDEKVRIEAVSNQWKDTIRFETPII